jgi:general secretion pathway protein N
LGGGLGLLVALLLWPPARWLAPAIGWATQGQVQLRQAQGTVWQGQAQVWLTGGAGSADATVLPSQLHWQLRPRWVGGPALALAVQAGCCVVAPWEWVLRLGWARVQLDVGDQASQWPAQWLAGLGTPWNTLQLRGQLALQPQGLGVEWASGRVQWRGQATLQALDLSSRLSTLQPMGSYALQLQGGAAPRVQLSTLQGQLQLQGSGQWVGGRLRFSGQAQAEPAAEAALANVLNIIGRRQGARAILQVG